MGEVSHQSQLPTAAANGLEQAQQVVSIAIGGESVWPVRQCPGAYPDGVDVSEPLAEQGLNRLSQHRTAHDQRITSSHQDIGDLRVSTEIGNQPIGPVHGELEALDANELRPAKTVRAIGMACLPRPRKVQHRLAIFVLASRQFRTV